MIESSFGSQPKTILIAGGRGLLGQHLSMRLKDAGHEVRILTTSRKASQIEPKCFYWNVKKGMIDTAAFDALDVIFNLAGVSIAGGRWSKKRKTEISHSRVEGTKLLATHLNNSGNRIGCYFGASAVGYYGWHPSDQEMTEDEPAGEGFLAEVCSSWEGAHQAFAPMTDKLIIGRLGNVLTAEGGFLLPFHMISRSGLGVLMGRNELAFPWIHIKDVTGFMQQCISGIDAGVFNVVAGSTQWKIFQRAIFKAFEVNLAITIPPLLLKLGLGERSELLLNSCAVSGQKMRNSGYKLKFSDLNSALKEVANEFRKLGD